MIGFTKLGLAAVFMLAAIALAALVGLAFWMLIWRSGRPIGRAFVDGMVLGLVPIVFGMAGILAVVEVTAWVR